VPLGGSGSLFLLHMLAFYTSSVHTIAYLWLRMDPARILKRADALRYLSVNSQASNRPYVVLVLATWLVLSLVWCSVCRGNAVADGRLVEAQDIRNSVWRSFMMRTFNQEVLACGCSTAARAALVSPEVRRQLYQNG